jgi:hypothetical protein
VAAQPALEQPAAGPHRAPEFSQIMLQLERRIDALEFAQRTARPSPAAPVKETEARAAPPAPDTRRIVRVITRQNPAMTGSAAFWERQSSNLVRGRLLR